MKRLRDLNNRIRLTDAPAVRKIQACRRVFRIALGSTGFGPCRERLDVRFRKRRIVGEFRSEERRVGKEGRSRWSPYHQKKKEVRTRMLRWKVCTECAMSRGASGVAES